MPKYREGQTDNEKDLEAKYCSCSCCGTDSHYLAMLCLLPLTVLHPKNAIFLALKQKTKTCKNSCASYVSCKGIKESC